MTEAFHTPRQAGCTGGYATATILVVIAIMGSTALWSYRETLTGRTVANARLFQARAAALAGIGLQAAIQRLRPQPQLPGLSWQQPAAGNNEQTDISTRLLRADSLPPGFSADRFIEYHHEVVSAAASGMGARVTQTMGLALLETANNGDLPAECPTIQPAHIRVQLDGSDQPIEALLLTGVEPVLRIADADTGQVLWSAGATSSARQQLFDGNTRITTSLTVLDTDSDGVHDRIYAGDHAGRIWRVDLHNGNDAERFASGSVFAELGAAGGQRAFLAAPDVSLAFDGAGTAWLNIAAGTTGLSGENRLFVLRDYAARTQWSDAEHRRWRPPHEQDLHAGGLATDLPAPPGYYFDLGAAQIFTPSITINGKVTYAVAATAIRDAGCNTRVRIGKFNIADGAGAQVTTHGDAAAGLPLRAQLESGERNHGLIRCTLGNAIVPQCSGFDPVRRSWWRREDAD